MARQTVKGSLNQQQETKQELAQPEAGALSAPWQAKHSPWPQHKGNRPFSTHSTPRTTLTAPAETQAHQGSCTQGAGQHRNRGYLLASYKCSTMKADSFTSATKVCLKQRRECHKVVHLFMQFIYPRNGKNIQTYGAPEVFFYAVSSTCLWLHLPGHLLYNPPFTLNTRTPILEVSLAIWETSFSFRFLMFQIKFLILSAAQRINESILITQIRFLHSKHWWLKRKHRTNLALQLAEVEALLVSSFQVIFFIVQLAPNESLLVLHRLPKTFPDYFNFPCRSSWNYIFFHYAMHCFFLFS